MRTAPYLVLAASIVLLPAVSALAQEDGGVPDKPAGAAPGEKGGKAQGKAGDEARRKEGAALVDQGIALYRAKQFARALPKFEAAYRLTTAWQVLVHIGMTQRRLGHYQEALASLQRYLREGGAQISENDRKLVEGEIALIRSLVAEVRVQVKTTGPVSIYVDDRLVGTTPLDPLLLDPGKYTIRAEKSGAIASVEIEVHAGKPRLVELAPAAPTGFLDIRSAPSGALIRIDGNPIGGTPSEHPIAVGHHRVHAALRGYVSQGKDVEVAPGKRMELFFDLDRPWYRKWQYWTAIGAGVVSVTATLLIVREIRRDNLDNEIHFPPNPS